MATNSGVFEQERTVADWDDDYYHPLAIGYYDAAVVKMLELLGAKPGSEVLDAGCGPGVHSIRAAKFGCTVKAIDISETMLGEARERVEAAGVADRVSFAIEDLTALSFANESFERIFSWGVLIHVPKVELAIDELVRVLKPGGRLALYVTNKGALDHKMERVARAILRRPAKDERCPLGSGRWYEMNGHQLWVLQFDIDALTKGLTDRGLRRIHRIGGEFSELQRRTGGMPRRALLRLNNLMYRLGLGTNLSSTNLLVFEKPASG